MEITVCGSKMIYQDGDIQVFDNIDHLYDLPDNFFNAMMDCLCVKNWSHSPHTRLAIASSAPDKVKWLAELGPKAALKTTPPTPSAEQVVK